MNPVVGKRLGWVLAISAPVVLVLSCAFLLFSGPDCAHRSDRAMERNFVQHRVDFEELLQLFREDSTLTAGPFLGEPTMTGLSRERANRYEQLYRRIGVRKIEREDGWILIRATTTHTFDRKGYAWCPQENGNCARSDAPGNRIVNGETTREFRADFRVLRPIAPHWYVYFQAMS